MAKIESKIAKTGAMLMQWCFGFIVFPSGSYVYVRRDVPCPAYKHVVLGVGDQADPLQLVCKSHTLLW